MDERASTVTVTGFVAYRENAFETAFVHSSKRKQHAAVEDVHRVGGPVSWQPAWLEQSSSGGTKGSIACQLSKFQKTVGPSTRKQRDLHGR